VLTTSKGVIANTTTTLLIIPALRAINQLPSVKTYKYKKKKKLIINKTECFCISAVLVVFLQQLIVLIGIVYSKMTVIIKYGYRLPPTLAFPCN